MAHTMSSIKRAMCNKLLGTDSCENYSFQTRKFFLLLNKFLTQKGICYVWVFGSNFLATFSWTSCS